MNDTVINAVITADFHMSASKDPSDAIVSLMKLQRPVFDAFFDMLVREGIDLLILCGDNTQSGSYEDMRMLEGYLKRLTEYGTRVIMAPGNHDFDQGSEELYERMFFPLLKPDERDEHSLSYLRRIGSYTFFAMDDHEKKRSSKGVLKEQTVQWLRHRLIQENENGQKIIFLSHHSLHADEWMSRPEFYCLAPAEVKDMLVRHGVRLACSGHLHDPKIYRSGLYEIVTPMLLGGKHMYGEMRLEENSLSCQLKPFKVNDPLLARMIREKDRTAYENRKAVFAKILKDSPDDAESDKALNSLMKWFDVQQSGMLYERREEFIHDEHFDRALRAFGESAWGRWIRALMNESCISSSSLHIEY